MDSTYLGVEPGPSGPILPPELVAHILSFTPASPKKLLRFCLVSHLWRSLVNPRMFRCFTVHVRRDHEPNNPSSGPELTHTVQEVLDFLIESPHVRRCVRELRLIYISGLERDNRTFQPHGVPLNAVRTIVSILQLEALEIAAPIVMSSEGPTTSPEPSEHTPMPIAKLTIWLLRYMNHGPEDQLTMLLSLFNRVDELNLKSIRNDRTLHSLQPPPTKFLVKRLSIGQGTGTSYDRSISFLSTVLDPAALISLTLTSPVASPRAMTAFFQTTCRGLQQLSFEDWSMQRFPDPAFSALQNLSILRLRINITKDEFLTPWTNEWERCMDIITNQVNERRLQEIHISFTHQDAFVQKVALLDWASFDAALTVHSRLRLVHFIVVAHPEPTTKYLDEIRGHLDSMLSARSLQLLQLSGGSD